MVSRDPLPTRTREDEESGAAEKATSVEHPRPARISFVGEKQAEGTVSISMELEQHAVHDDRALGTTPSRGRAESSGFEHLVGASLGSFRLIKPLASGGMGAVFLARKEGLSGVRQHAALKLIHQQLASETDFIDMFLDEARIAFYVQHPNVCRVLDFGLHEGTYYLAMEYVHGETWGELSIRLGGATEAAPLVPALTAFVLAQACEGLHAAHTAMNDEGEPLQIVHRDVSPQNIFVAYDGTVRVIDFGVARARDRITSTRAGVVKGKIAYMSPEQIAGAQIDQRSDIWALGVLLREGLEGKRLFRRNNDTETVRALMVEPIPPWSVTVHPELRAIADKALARDVSQRFQSAREMGAALGEFLLKQPLPVGSPELSQWMHRLFPQELEQKRALLRSDGSSSSAQVAKLLETEVDLPTRRPQPRAPKSAGRLEQGKRLAIAGAVLMAALGAAYALRSSKTESAAPTVQVVTSTPDKPGPRLAPKLEPVVQPLPVEQLKPEVEPVPTVETPLPVRQDSKVRKVATSSDKASAAPQGTVLIAYAKGWAEVWERSKKLGTTPGKFRLPVGAHTLLIKPLGKGPGVTQRVLVQANETTKLLLP